MMRQEFSEIVRQAAKAGAAEVMKAMNPKEDAMSQREAYAEFGRAFVRKMETEDKLTIIRKGSKENSKKLYSRAELTQLVAARNVCRNIIRIESTIYQKGYRNGQIDLQKPVCNL